MKLHLLSFTVLLLCVMAVVRSSELPAERANMAPKLDSSFGPLRENGTLSSTGKLLHRTASQGDTVSIALDSSFTTNQSLADDVCSRLTSNTVRLSLREGTSRAWFLLPDCVYRLGNSIVHLEIHNILLLGNSSFPDPLRRLALAISTTPTTFSVRSCHLRTDTGAIPTIDWNTLSTVTSSVSELNFAQTNLGIGAVLPTFPRPIAKLVLYETGLAGTLPTSLFASSSPPIDKFSFIVDNNDLTGPIPPNFFAGLSLPSLSGFELNLARNSLNGTIPAGLLSGSLSETVAIHLNSNSFEGPLANLFASLSLSNVRSFYFFGSYNYFTGSTPTKLNSMTDLQDFTFDCSSCGFQTLTSFLSPSISTTCTVVVTNNNQLSGDIPADFFQFATSPQLLTVWLSGNSLTGIPRLASANFSASQRIDIDLSSNKLTGPFPTHAGLFGVWRRRYLLKLFDNPTLIGTVPASFLASFATPESGAAFELLFDVHNTSLTGALALPDLTKASTAELTLRADKTNFLSLTHPSNASSRLRSLHLDNNPSLSGEISVSLFSLNPNLVTLFAPTTNLSGIMPDMGALNHPKLTQLNLAFTLIDFCSGNRTVWASSQLFSCDLSSTSAHYCENKYPSICQITAPPPTRPPSPTSAPTGCAQSTRPSPTFVCINGTWTFVGSVDSTVITIPSGASTTTIEGNLTSSTVIISGLNSVLVVDGCTANVTIIIELTPEQLKTIGSDGKLQPLLSYSNTSSCTPSLSDINIATKINGSSCQKVSVSKESSSDGTVSGLFKIDKSDCDRWWIILVSVIAAIVVLVVVLVLLALFVPPIRECVRPYSKRNRAPEESRLK